VPAKFLPEYGQAIAGKQRSGTESVRMADGNSGIVGDADLVLTSFYPARENQFAYAKTQITSGQRLSVISENWSK
jgi:hypothetical protein